MRQDKSLHRGLEERHLRLMALGTAIGVGLFLGSANAIHTAGPAILVSYLIAGAAIFVIMRALGEMAVAKPVAGSFSRYAQDEIGPLAGYLVGWTYWLTALAAAMCETAAVGIYMSLWFPNVAPWIWALAALLSVGVVNFLAVKAFGELEFWFALVKVVTIILVIVTGIGMIFIGIGNGGVPTGISNLWRHNGFMPNGIKGVLMALPMVMFAYQGIEMLGVTAGEAKNPEKTLSRAVNAVFLRVLVFYVGALFVIMAIFPWDQLGTHGSPFVMTFDKLGIRSAAGIVNFVVLTAALSSCNSNLYGMGRLAYNLAQQGQAPRICGKVLQNGVPGPAIWLSVICLFAGILLNYLAPKQVFVWLTSISTFGAIWTWGTILVSHDRFRRRTAAARTAAQKSSAIIFPFGSYATGLFLTAVFGFIGYFPETRIAAIVGPIWIAVLVAAYYGFGHHRQVGRLSVGAGGQLQ
ncbi:amino acid permease [Paraburkholderia guartelaensis]|uniref:Amino acid permease n=1 Tax=Paraburkholderia guartelaensis TaxID=2546446 RepID=A0A4R5L770_9BURK|nr:amino acid permease [Paraburkholderia guartelaensis]TDG03530.1 amino acid permease [Paraburkholderia guartelaensis]